MVTSIKNKFIIAVLALILTIQIISTGTQYNQVKSIFFGEFVIGAQSIAQNPFLDLNSRLDYDVNRDLENDETEADRAEFLSSTLKIKFC